MESKAMLKNEFFNLKYYLYTCEPLEEVLIDPSIDTCDFSTTVLPFINWFYYSENE
ncbi:MAG: hypothetical protein RL045_1725 [Bacteroidota bacterium]|jgi:hypothetical protein